jgi:NRAMP (natural resistance-associated macrophage protein)-like metal ion transporter
MLKRWRIRILLFLAILGPGFITANVDNDAGGILTYSQAGAQFGYTLLWTIIPITLALIVVQEMCARMGVVTGKGLSDLIREEFGLRITVIVMILLVVVNFGNVVAEFSGIAGSLQLFHLSKYISVPVCAVLVWLLVVKGDYKGVEGHQQRPVFINRGWHSPAQQGVGLPSGCLRVAPGARRATSTW